MSKFATYMRHSNLIRLFITLGISSLLIINMLYNSGCANIVPPQGGPRDTLPPLLVAIDPRDSMTNFDDRTITLEFDEYVTLENIQQNLLVTPTPARMPVVNARLRTVTVKLIDTLEQNTTYTIDFGSAIRDVNEGNVLRGFSYIFTTGEFIDSLELSGKVLLAETGKVDTTLVVMLHRSGDDSAVVNQRPRYVTRLDGNGNFRFRFLPAGTFYIYALKDEGNTRRYLNRSQLFAFADSAVLVGIQNDPVTLYAFNEKPATPPGALISQRTPTAGRGDDRRLRYFTNLNNQPQDLLSPFVINFEQPLTRFDSSRLVLTIDSGFTPVPGYRWLLDSSAKKLTLAINWEEDRIYNLVLDREFAEDSLGRMLLKTDTIQFKTRATNEYGSLRIRFRNLDPASNPLVQFLQNSQVVGSYPLTSEVLELDRFKPGEYEIRILYDRNRNGSWDPGNFFNGRVQPEIVQPVERKFTIRPGFDNQFEVVFGG